MSVALYRFYRLGGDGGQIPRGWQAGQDVPKTQPRTAPWPGILARWSSGIAIMGSPQPADGGVVDGPRGVPGPLSGPGGRSVAVQDLRLVLVPRGRGAVRVQDQGPALLVDHDLVVEKTEQDAVLDAGLAAVASCA